MPKYTTHDWRAVHDAWAARLTEEGMQEIEAREAGYWFAVRDAMLALNCDAYEGAAALYRQQVPAPGNRPVWVRLRDGDRFTPGTRAGAIQTSGKLSPQEMLEQEWLKELDTVPPAG